MQNISIPKHDYKDYLVENVPDPNSSDYDTDDLIEDAKNFVNASKTKLVDVEVWKEIDQNRRQKRLSRHERNQKKNSGNIDTLPFVPKHMSDLAVGNNIRVITKAGDIDTGVVK